MAAARAASVTITSTTSRPLRVAYVSRQRRRPRSAVRRRAATTRARGSAGPPDSTAAVVKVTPGIWRRQRPRRGTSRREPARRRVAPGQRVETGDRGRQLWACRSMPPGYGRRLHLSGDGRAVGGAHLHERAGGDVHDPVGQLRLRGRRGRRSRSRGGTSRRRAAGVARRLVRPVDASASRPSGWSSASRRRGRRATSAASSRSPRRRPGGPPGRRLRRPAAGGRAATRAVPQSPAGLSSRRM